MAEGATFSFVWFQSVGLPTSMGGEDGGVEESKLLDNWQNLHFSQFELLTSW